MTTPPDLARIVTLATAAQEVAPGPYRVAWDPDDAADDPGRRIDGITDANGEDVIIADSGVYPPRGAVAEFIGAMSPDVVRALARRTVEAERERDDARAALAEACAELRQHNREYLARADEDTEYEHNTDDARLHEWEGIAAGGASRPPLDPVHVEALRGMLAIHEEDLGHMERSIATGRGLPGTTARLHTWVAALTAVLEKEESR